MSVVIETLVICDICGEQNSGDDRHSTAKEIRKNRKAWGWKFVNGKDYCPECVAKSNARTKGKG